MRLFSLCLILLFVKQASAFNGLVHDQIVRSVFVYLNTHEPLFVTTKKWLKAKNKIEPILIRSIVDVDFQADLWLSSWYRAPFAGGRAKYLGMLTSLYHFTNVTKPGIFWEYDGYAYRHTDGTGNDFYLGIPGMKIRGDLSFPLGGSVYNDAQRRSMTYLGIYRGGFKGNERDWQHFFFEGPAAAAVLPPSYVPAQMAYFSFLKSKLAAKDKTEEWDGFLPIAENYIFTKKLKYHYRRQELKGFPLALDSLGVVFHMVQDLAMPHHAQGLAGYCHTELEVVVDELACGLSQPPDLTTYQTGYFDALPPRQCQNLYDPILVTDILHSLRLTLQSRDQNQAMDIQEIFVQIGKQSAKWKFGKLDKKKIATRLPDQTMLSGKDCQILHHPFIYKQIQFQYNMAVAYSLYILEKAMHEWEIKNAHVLMLEK